VTDSSALHRCWYFSNQKRVQQDSGLSRFLQWGVQSLYWRRTGVCWREVTKGVCCTKCQLQPIV